MQVEETELARKARVQQEYLDDVKKQVSMDQLHIESTKNVPIPNLNRFFITTKNMTVMYILLTLHTAIK